MLSPTGVYICITYGLPEQRMDYFRKPEFYWNPIQHKIAKPTISTSAVVATEDKNEKNFHYIYVMRKQAEKKEWFCFCILLRPLLKQLYVLFIKILIP